MAFQTPKNVDSLKNSRVYYNNSLNELLNNFAGTTEPASTDIVKEGACTAPSAGMLWFDTNSGVLRANNGSSFSMSGVAYSDSQINTSGNRQTGDLVFVLNNGDPYVSIWYDNELKPITSDNPVFDGTVTCATLTQTSDYRLKEYIYDLPSVTERLKKLKPVSYNFKAGGEQNFGFIAHELQEHFPELVTGEKDGKEYQTVKLTSMIGVLTKALQEMIERVEYLESKANG